MLSSFKSVQLACVAAAVGVANVEAHGYMSVPKATFAINGDPTQFCGTIDGPATLTAPSGGAFTSDPDTNARSFTQAFKAQTTYSSLRDLIDKKTVFISGANKECGVTSPTGTKQPLPDKYVEWAHTNEEGFTPSHQGPCEVWCDNTRVFQDDNCSKNYVSAPAKLPYDRSKCLGTSMLKIYWIALQSSTWQSYINCAPLQATSGGSASSPVVSPSTTPKATTKTPTSTTSAPKATTSAPKATTSAPKATTAAPKATTAAPKATTTTPKATTKAPETGADADEDCDELEIPTTSKPASTKTPKPSKTPKKTKAAKTPKPTKKESRSMEYGFDELDEDN